MTAQQQQALDALYALDNVLTVNITMPHSDWDNLRKEEPKGGRCGFEFIGGGRYSWGEATSVEISGTKLSRRNPHVQQGGHQEEILLRLDRRQEAVPAA